LTSAYPGYIIFIEGKIMYMEDVTMSEAIIDLIKKYKIVTIIRGISPDKIVKTAEALYNGGIRLIEVTFDQTKAIDNMDTFNAIKELTEVFGEKIGVGAGTVMTEDQLDTAYRAGAKYIISPNADPAIIKKTKELGLVSIPGVFTPTEIASAYKFGADIVKVFPAAELGAGYIKAIRAPLKHIPMMAVGGINEKNMSEYFSAGVCSIGIGSNIVKESLVNEGKYEEITRLARLYTENLKA